MAKHDEWEAYNPFIFNRWSGNLAQVKQATTVQNLFYFPVKGCGGTEITSTLLHDNAGIPFDRGFAFRYQTEVSSDLPTLKSFPWATKANFAVQHDWPGLARLRCAFEPTTAELRLSCRSDEPLVSAPVDTELGRAKLSAFATDFLRGLNPSRPSRQRSPRPLELVGSPDGSTRYTDRAKMPISILNLASLRELEQAAGARLDVRRFRGNIVVDGIPAWAELGWEGKIIRVGETEIEIKAPIHRCHNINVEPDSGDDRIRALETLKERFGHGKFGVGGIVLKPGAISVGDVAMPVGAAATQESR